MGQAKPGAWVLPRSGATLELLGQLHQLGTAACPHGVALGQQSATRVDVRAPPEAGLARRQQLRRFTRRGQLQRFVVLKFSGSGRVVQFDDVEIAGLDASQAVRLRHAALRSERRHLGA